MLTRGQVLSPFPPSFRDPDSPVSLPASTLHFRAAARAAPTSSAPRPRVYVTLGTVFNSASGDLFERVLAGLAGLDAEVVATVGHNLDPADFGPRPAHVRIERFVPQAEILPESDLVVSHGGSGSLMATLAHGLPSVLLPLGADQPHNAQRAQELGLALTRDAATATPTSIGGTVQAALYDVPMRRRTRAMADEIDALPGVHAVIARLTELADLVEH
jgi:MGT family glycosyltransferase